MELLRTTGTCALIFIACAGLGSAGFWVATRTEEPVTHREAKALIRSLFLSALASWVLMLVVPGRMLRTAGAFFIVYAILLGLVLWIARRKIINPAKEAPDE